MSLFRFPRLRSKAASRDNFRNRARRDSGRASRALKPRRLSVDPLEERMLLTLAPLEATDTMVNPRLDQVQIGTETYADPCTGIAVSPSGSGCPARPRNVTRCCGPTSPRNRRPVPGGRRRRRLRRRLVPHRHGAATEHQPRRFRANGRRRKPGLQDRRRSLHGPDRSPTTTSTPATSPTRCSGSRSPTGSWPTAAPTASGRFSLRYGGNEVQKISITSTYEPYVSQLASSSRSWGRSSWDSTSTATARSVRARPPPSSSTKRTSPDEHRCNPGADPADPVAESRRRPGGRHRGRIGPARLRGSVRRRVGGRGSAGDQGDVGVQFHLRVFCRR